MQEERFVEPRLELLLECRGGRHTPERRERARSAALHASEEARAERAMPVLEVIVHEARQLRTAARGVYVSVRVDGTRESLEPQKSDIENETTNPSFGSANFRFSLDREDLQYAELVIEVKADGVDRRSQMIGKVGVALAKVNAAAMEKIDDKIAKVEEELKEAKKAKNASKAETLKKRIDKMQSERMIKARPASGRTRAAGP